MADAAVDRFRRLDVEGIDAVPSASHGPAPQLQWVDVGLLVVDTSYQRDSDGRNSRRRIAEIAANFSWTMFAPVIVSPIVGGLYAIVDGQHRTRGAMLCGIGSVPCQVIIADAIGQARAFEAINNQVTNVTPQQIFKAKVASGDPVATRVKRVAGEAGVTIMTSHKTAADAGPGETMALSAITKAIEFHGEDRARLALTLLRRSSERRRGALVAAVVTALVEALAERPDLAAAPDLADRSAGVDYASLRSESMRLAVVDDSRRARTHLRDLMIAALAGGPP